MNYREDPFLLSFFKAGGQLKVLMGSPPSRELIKKIRAWLVFFHFEHFQQFFTFFKKISTLISFNFFLLFESEIVILEESVNTMIMQKNLTKKPSSKQFYLTNHSILQELKTSQIKEIKAKEKLTEKNSLSPSKIKKKNAFEIIPLEIFEEELEKTLTDYFQQISNTLKELFASSIEEIMRNKKDFCEFNLLEVRNSNKRTEKKEGLAILFVNKVQKTNLF